MMLGSNSSVDFILMSWDLTPLILFIFSLIEVTIFGVDNSSSVEKYIYQDLYRYGMWFSSNIVIVIIIIIHK